MLVNEKKLCPCKVFTSGYRSPKGSINQDNGPPLYTPHARK